MKKIQLLIMSILLVGLGLTSCGQKESSSSSTNTNHALVAEDAQKYKHWVWLNPDPEDTDEELATRYQKYADAGIVGIFFERDSERHFRAAKAKGLQAHRWLWIMNRGDVVANHPEWAAISRSGQSTADNPPYVDYYRWMCPSRPEVLNFLKNDVEEQLSKDYIDGIHFDYIRYSDVVLAVNLWDLYGIVQTEELPQYDFCYCDECKKKFKTEYGKDIDSIQYPQESLSWREFRYNSVSNIVNNLVEVAHKHNKPATAAVFPTPDVAKKLVLQDWTNWPLDAVFPMIYHGFYKEDVAWIGSAVKQGLRGLDGRYPIYAGLYVPDFKDVQDFEEGVKYALNNGASGVSIFGDVSDELLAVINKYKTRQQ